MRPARLVAALAVLLVIGLAGVASGAAGDPLILGTRNVTGPNDITSLGGRLEIDSLEIPPVTTDTFTVQGRTHFFGPVTFSCTSGLIVIPAGQIEGSTPPSSCVQAGGAIVATIQNAQRGRYVAGVGGSGNTITIFLNKPARVDTTVAFLEFDF